MKLTDGRGKTLASVRKIILEVDREIIAEWKWMGKAGVRGAPGSCR